jgi:hypothetical protein
MPTPVETLTAANESALKLVTTFQERVLEAQKGLYSALQSTVDSSSSLVPSANDSGIQRDVIEEDYAFRTRLLEANKAFTLGLLDVWLPAEKPARSAKK